MRPYGVRVVEEPDAADIKAMGSAGRAGNLPGRNGRDLRPCSRGSSKRRMRRFWARKARAAGKAACQEES